MDFSFDNLNYNSVENVPGFEARASFTLNSATVFKEDIDIVPTIVDETLSYIPWGGNNLLPFNIIDLIEKDETLATCQVFNAEVCYGSGLRIDTCLASQTVRDEIEDFMLDNDLAAYFLGVSQYFKHFLTARLQSLTHIRHQRKYASDLQKQRRVFYGIAPTTHY